MLSHTQNLHKEHHTARNWVRAAGGQCNIFFNFFFFFFCRIVSTYLVHHGYCATAESFARNTGQAFEEELASIKNRQSKGSA